MITMRKTLLSTTRLAPVAGMTAALLLALPAATSLLNDTAGLSIDTAFAQGQGGGGQGGGGGGGGHDSGEDSSHDDSSHDDSDHEDGEGGPPEGRGQGQGGQGQGGSGGQGGAPEDAGNRPPTAGEADEDSDRPAWAGREGDRTQTPGRGNQEPGEDKGDLYGDLYVVYRTPDGTPITTDQGYVQPIAFYADGTMVLDENGDPVLLELNEEGEVVEGQTYDGQPIGPEEVEFGRTNVGRAPDAVLEHSLDEALTKLAEADEWSFDAAGRLVLTTVADDGTVTTSTIDSPLENLALYIATMTTDMPFTIDNATSFLAAATDKSEPVTVDEIAYLNANILGLETIDLSSFTYDRSSYDDVEVTWLERQDDGSYVETTATLAEIGDRVFTFDPTNSYLDPDDPIMAFTQAIDDARAVILFEHDLLWDIY